MFNAVEDWVYNPILVIDSAVLAINQVQTLAHGLGVRPKYVQVSIVCISADDGYSVDDEVFQFSNYSESTGRRWAVAADATNFITIIENSGAFLVMAKGGGVGTITMNKWKFRIRYKAK
jgi:hypothetical protein